MFQKSRIFPRIVQDTIFERIEESKMSQRKLLEMKNIVTETKSARDALSSRLDRQKRELVKWRKELRTYFKMIHRETEKLNI